MKEQTYYLLSSLSIDASLFPKKLKVVASGVETEIVLSPSSHPARFAKPRRELLRSRTGDIAEEPESYCRFIAKVKAKTEAGAFHRALRAIDLQRAIWCLMGNSTMVLSLGFSTPKPINVVRLGSKHTVHLSSGQPASDNFWFEPNFVLNKLFRPTRADAMRSNSRWVLRRIKRSRYGDRLEAALLRFVRALDESDANTAFLRLWGAVESLTTSGQADYDQLVKRCSFLFKETEFHRQLLEHLREYRNQSVHSGEESDAARTNCYQLQMYFVELIWFHLRNASVFSTVEEANGFLDLPIDKALLQTRLRMTKKAIGFVS